MSDPGLARLAAAPRTVSVPSLSRARSRPGSGPGSRSRSGPGEPGPDAASPTAAAPDAVPEDVWYASYGSNLLRERFRCYLVGGTPPGSRHHHPPSDAPREPGEDLALLAPGALVFAGDASPWGGGGVAFWDPDGPGTTLMRGWRLTLAQFLEVVHLENGGRERARAAVPEQLWRTGETQLTDGWYGRLVVLTTLAGLPVVTFTSPRAASLEPAAPSAAYATVVRRGLLETFGPSGRGSLTPAEADGYLGAARGYRAGGSRSS